MPSTPPTPAPEPLYRLHITYTRALWLRSEWPAILLWVGFTLLGLILAGCLVAASRWFLLALPFYLVILWLFSGAKAVTILLFLLRGREAFSLLVFPDRVLAGSDPHWTDLHARGLEDHGSTWVLWGLDGRYRAVIPKDAVTPEQLAALRAACRPFPTPTSRPNSP